MVIIPARDRPDLSRFLQSQVNVRLAQSLPLELFRFYIYSLGLSYYALKRKERLKISDSVCRTFRCRYSQAGLYRLILKTYLGICEHYFEKLVNAHRSLQEMIKFLRSNVAVRNRHWLDESVESGKGCLLITGHFGAVEFLPLFLSIAGYKPAMVVRFKTKKLREISLGKIEKLDLEIIDADNANAIYKSLEALKKGRVLITLCDEFKHWKPYHDKRVTILGTNVAQDKTLDVLYRRTRAPACLGLMKRDNGRFTLHINPIATGADKVSVSARSWNILEQYIRKYPEQWYQWREIADRQSN